MKKALTISLILSCTVLFGADKVMYASKVKPLYLDGKSTKVVGKLLPTSKVTILGKDGGKLHVKLDGFMLDGLDRAMYYAVGKRILVSGMSGEAGFKFQKGKAFTDKATGKTWKEASFEAYVKEGDLVDSEKELFEKAKKMYEQTCSMCHSLHEPTEFTANQWPSTVKGMASRAGINTNDRYLITEYLQKHAK